MSFKKAAQLSAYLSKDYAEDFFRLLVNYQDISASEAASRLSVHIRTAQDFLEGLTTVGVVEKNEVHEKKRPYFRYNLKENTLKIEIDLTEFAMENPSEGLARLVREMPEARANFKVSRSGDQFSSVTIWKGGGRELEEQHISLTTPQGKFLFHLPFPQSRPLSIAEVMEKAGVEEEYSSEIQDIVDELARLGILEFI